MKLRIDPDKISFRIDFDELEQLLEKGKLQETTALPEGSLTYKIICMPAKSSPEFLVRDGDYVLSLARDVIEEHKTALPSLKGVVNIFGRNAKVSLEVNLKKKLKRSLEQ